MSLFFVWGGRWQ